MKKIIAKQYNPAERINELDNNTDERYGGMFTSAVSMTVQLLIGL